MVLLVYRKTLAKSDCVVKIPNNTVQYHRALRMTTKFVLNIEESGQIIFINKYISFEHQSLI